MKLIKLAPIAALIIMNGAHAIDGNINFTGEITANTCTVDGGNTDKIVTLGSVPASALATKGQIAGNQKFTLSLSACTGSATAVAARFESLASGSPEGRLKLDSASSAKNVEIALFDANGVMQPVNGVVPTESYVNLDANKAELNYMAAYYATGQAETGSANATVSYTLSYQ